MRQTLIKATKAAERILKQEFKTLKPDQVRRKSKREVVTPADRKSEREIVKIIKEKYPEHSIIAEEGGRDNKKSDYTWIIDPLDGTFNFTIKDPLFGVSIALSYQNEVIMGAMGLPMTNEFYIAEKGKGALYNGKKIKVSGVKRFQNSVVTYCHGRQNEAYKESTKFYSILKMKIQDTRRFGCAVAECGFVASGRTEGFYVNKVNVWDVAAGSIIVKEAGGIVTDFENKPWTIRSKDFLATNRYIHDDLLTIIKKVRKR